MAASGCGSRRFGTPADGRSQPTARAAASALERYRRGLPPDHGFFVTTRQRDAAGREEQVFVVVDSVHPGRIHGRIWNDIRGVQGYSRAQYHVLS